MVILSITREIQIIHSNFALNVALIFIGKIYISKVLELNAKRVN